MAEFDFVIVGGGTAGCILAYRLAEKGHSVCVLEAGPRDSTPWIKVPVGFTKTLPNPKWTWQYKYQGCEGTNNRETPLVTGRTLGGSSAVNGAVYNRGQAEDFDMWAQQGNLGWAYSDVVPYFNKSERLIGLKESRHRGRAGKAPVTRHKWRRDVGELFLAGAESLGIPVVDEYNEGVQGGVSYVQSTILNNRRWSMAHAFLHSAPKHFKIEVITSAEATRIVFEGKRATGIRYLHDGNTEERIAQARKAVILSSGAIGSPKLMQLSGIGDENGLKDAGVSVHHHLPGVGRNFHDHYTVRVSRRAKAHVKSINELVRGPGLVKEAANWFIGRPSVLALSPVLIYGFCRSDAALDTPDFALSYFPASYKAGQIGYLDDQPGLTCGAFQLRPESRGHVRIVSPDVHDTPEIQPNFLAEHNDRRVIIAGLKCARAVLTSTPMQALIEEELLPGSSVNTDDEWLEYARSNGSTGYHPVGTCKMGPAVNSSSVVSSTLQVHGLESLYVIDASIIPQIPSANTMAATMMIAEKGAEFVLQ